MTVLIDSIYAGKNKKSIETHSLGFVAQFYKNSKIGK